MILKNENDIYLYFETIEQLEPKHILDVGMFLKRIGSVSRKVMDREVLADIRLDGIDFFPEKKFAVWECIYDSIIDAASFLKDRREESYDLAVFLGTETLTQKPGFAETAEKAAKCVRYLLADQNLQQWNEALPKSRIKKLNLEGKLYFLFDFGA